MEKEVVITYETLFEILRREKAREDVQTLPENFNEEVKKYIREKKQTMLTPSGDQFSEIEQEKRQRQMLNIKKILNELYDRRERKIVNMALSKSRMPRSVVDCSSLTESEKGLFSKLIATLNDSRQDSLKEVLLESISLPEERKDTVEKQQPEIPIEQVSEEEGEETQPQEGKPVSFKLSDSMQKVRFVCDVPQFVGPNLEIYGPFKAEEMAVLPLTVCDVLLNRNKAELDENSPQEG